MARNTYFTTIATLILFLCSSTAFSATTDEFTFSCLPLTIQQSDPIVSPGTISSHTHIVAGGTAFQRTMGKNTARNAKGTTCSVEIDKSNYWVPQIYHRMRNGAFEMVKMESSSIYYFNRACSYHPKAQSCGKGPNAVAPPPGLRMIAGNPMRRTYDPANFEHRATSHMCIHPDGQSSETKRLPRRRCAKLRSQVFMPSCWDGKNLDSPDHKSHMAYPAVGDYNKGVCPKSHPVAIYSIFLEFIYNTERYPDFENWVYAMGDETGFGLHGDFIHGWTDQKALQRAVETCTGPKGLTDPNCSITKRQKTAIAPVTHHPEIPAPNDNIGQHGPLKNLPGSHPVKGPV